MSSVTKRQSIGLYESFHSDNVWMKTVNRCHRHRFLHYNLRLKGRAHGIDRRACVPGSDLHAWRFTAAYAVVPTAVHNSAHYRSRARFPCKLLPLGFVFFLFYKNICHKIKHSFLIDCYRFSLFFLFRLISFPNTVKFIPKYL